MPNMSQTSRSYQLALGQMPVMVSSESADSCSGTFRRMYWLRREGEEGVDDGEIARRLAFRMNRMRSSIAVRS